MNYNPLLKAIEKVEQYELTEREYPYTATGLISVETVIEILSELELDVRNLCECEETKRLITDKAY